MLRLAFNDPLVPTLFEKAELAPLRKLDRIKRGRKAGQITVEQEIELGLEARRLFGFVRDYPFATVIGRRWKFDFAWQAEKLAVEFEGLILTSQVDAKGKRHVQLGGRHASITGFREDCVKYSKAAMLGWCVLRYDRELVRSGALYEDVAAELAKRRAKR